MGQLSLEAAEPVTACSRSSAERSDIELLHAISVELIGEQDSQALYGKIVDAAVAIMRSQFGTMQELCPPGDPSGHGGQLHLLASRGLSAEAVEFWRWVSPAAQSSCTWALRSGGRAIVPDFERWGEIAGTPDLMAFRQAGIRAAQTTPLLSRKGNLLGMLSTHWREPHQPSERDLRLIDIIARQAADLLERTIAEEALRARERQLDSICAALRESEDRCRMVADNIAQLAWTCAELGQPSWANRRWVDYTGLDAEAMQGVGWTPALHPDHAGRVAGGIDRARESGEAWEDTFPLRGRDGEYRWFLSRAVPIRGPTGEIVQWFGTNTDITERIHADELQKTLAGELTHRVKNMLATVQAIATQTLRHGGSPGEFITSFGGRIQSMSRVHSQLSTNQWQRTRLREIIHDQVNSGAVGESRVGASGPEVWLDAEAVPQMAMMVHELGTNSIKYGALSTPDGRVTIRWTVSDGSLHLHWTEHGGPAVEAPVRRGFGTALIEGSAQGAGGRAQMSLEGEGVRWEITLPLPSGRPAHADAADPAADGRGEGRLRQIGKPVAVPAKVLAGKRLLVVEDEPLVAMDIMAHLEDAGAEIVGPAGHAAAALSLIGQEHFDAALLDANLAGAPVDEIAAALMRKSVPFAFVSGYAHDSLSRRFSATQILSKPFSARQLVELAAGLADMPIQRLKPREASGVVPA